MLAALFIAATLWRPVGVLALVVAILAVAGFEYFGKVTEKGYRPAVAPGLAACVAAPLAAYWIGEQGLPLVIAFAFIAGAARVHRRRRRGVRARCRTWPSRRWAWCGSGSSARTPP